MLSLLNIIFFSLLALFVHCAWKLYVAHTTVIDARFPDGAAPDTTPKPVAPVSTAPQMDIKAMLAAAVKPMAKAKPLAKAVAKPRASATTSPVRPSVKITPLPMQPNDTRRPLTDDDDSDDWSVESDDDNSDSDIDPVKTLRTKFDKVTSENFQEKVAATNNMAELMQLAMSTMGLTPNADSPFHDVLKKMENLADMPGREFGEMLPTLKNIVASSKTPESTVPKKLRDIMLDAYNDTNSYLSLLPHDLIQNMFLDRYLLTPPYPAGIAMDIYKYPKELNIKQIVVAADGRIVTINHANKIVIYDQDFNIVQIFTPAYNSQFTHAVGKNEIRCIAVSTDNIIAIAGNNTVNEYAMNGVPTGLPESVNYSNISGMCFNVLNERIVIDENTSSICIKGFGVYSFDFMIKPSCVVCDYNNNIYVADVLNKIYVFTRACIPLRTIELSVFPKLNCITALAIDADGNLLISSNSTIWVVNKHDEVVYTFTDLRHVRSMVVNTDGYIMTNHVAQFEIVRSDTE